MPSNVNLAKLFLIEASLAANDLENVSVSVDKYFELQRTAVITHG
jgi:hypothetical protein